MPTRTDSNSDSMSREAQDAKPLDTTEQSVFSDIVDNYSQTAMPRQASTDGGPETAMPGQANTDASLDQLEAFANDPANHDDTGTVPSLNDVTKHPDAGGFDEPGATLARPVNPAGVNEASNDDATEDGDPTDRHQKRSDSGREKGTRSDETRTQTGQDTAQYKTGDEKGGKPSGDSQDGSPADTSEKTSLTAKVINNPDAQQFAQRFGSYVLANRKKLLGGGFISVLIGATLFAGLPFLDEINLSNFMQNESSHGLRFLTHGYVTRQKLIIKDFLRENLDPNFDPNSSIVNYDRSMTRELYSKMKDDERYVEALKEAGYKVETRVDPGWPKGRIVKISYNGGTIDANDPNSLKNFDVTYRTVIDGPQARRHMDQIFNDVFKDREVLGRVSSRRLQILTGVKLHWIDRLTGPIDKIKFQIRNEVMMWIVEHSGAWREAVIQLLYLITGEKLDKGVTQQITEDMAQNTLADGAVTELTAAAAEKPLTKALISNLSKLGFDASNPIGWAVLIITAECKINAISTDGYDRFMQLAKDKATAEYTVQYVAMNSSLSQLHDPNNNTNFDTINAMVEMLTDKNNRDYSQSNNFKRSYGENVPYTHTDDCSSGVELCDSMRPQTMMDKTFLARGLKRMQDDPLNNNFLTKYVMFLGPKGVLTPYMCKALDLLANLVTESLIAQWSFYFTHFASADMQKSAKDLEAKTGEFVMTHMFMPILGWIIPPVVNADTRGPQMANAVMAGALGAGGMLMRDFCGTPGFGDPQASKQCLLSGAQLLVSENAIRQQDLSDEQAKPLMERVASINNPRSFLSRFLMQLPGTPGQAVAKVANAAQYLLLPNLVHAAVVNAPNLLSTPADADSTEEPTGVDIYGYTEDCLQNTKLNDGSRPECAGMDRFDDSAACTMLASESQGQDMPADCNKGLDPQTADAADYGKFNWSDYVDHPIKPRSFLTNFALTPFWKH